nr:MAG TPA: hypothetical protein [Caudoviricetes sp.]
MYKLPIVIASVILYHHYKNKPHSRKITGASITRFFLNRWTKYEQSQTKER